MDMNANIGHDMDMEIKRQIWMQIWKQNIGMDRANQYGYRYKYKYRQYIPYQLHVNCSLGITNMEGR